MPEQQATYLRIAGTGYRNTLPIWATVLLFFVIGIFVFLMRGRRVRLWLGSDHLLSVDFDGYNEYYKRFRYEDIQSIIVRKTNDAKLANRAAIFALIACIVLGAVSTELAWKVFFAILMAGAGLILVVNMIRGPTCSVWLKTAVQNEELVSLKRLRDAEAALGILRQRIQAAQPVHVAAAQENPPPGVAEAVLGADDAPPSSPQTL